MAEPRRTIWPVVGAGVASAGLCAIAGHQPWARGDGGRTSGLSTLTIATEAGRVPGCTALALVLLACWGVVLVTRGRVRRLVAGLGLLAAVGAAVTVVVGLAGTGDDVRSAYAGVGVDDVQVHHTAWGFLAVPAVAVAVAAAAAAVRLTPSWPEMARRYDAPQAAPSRTQVAVGGDQDDITVWKAISEGRDPTA